jgi:choline-sulfatase
MSDEHNKRVLGCSGHPMIKTPNLDKLAARGTRFTNAYTNSPICVPARASLATGRYPHQTRYWDNAIAYDGKIPSWGHRLMAQGHHVTSIGKLHYVDSDPRRNGFDEEIVPLHIQDGVGDLIGLIRDELPVKKGARQLGPKAGKGTSNYTQYDTEVADHAVRWLGSESQKYQDKPWMLYVGFVSPHFPLIAPPEFYDMYPEADVPWPDMYEPEARPQHPFLDAMRRCYCYDEGFDAPMVRKAIAAYFGLTSFLDHNIGRILAVLDELGLTDTTRIVYSSDHGDNLGTRGLWGKSVMYEESAGIPLIMAGPDVPSGRVCDTAVSLVDAFPTIIDAVGAQPHPDDASLPGTSLFRIAAGQMQDRQVLSEYHAACAVTGSFMIRKGRYKYIHYVGLPPMLFDIEDDPFERIDLATDPKHKTTLVECEQALRTMVDPEAADRNAKADQVAQINEHGGKDKIMKRGSFLYSPPPGAKAEFNS